MSDSNTPTIIDYIGLLDYSRINEPCKLQEFLKTLSEEDRNKPIGFSCNCPRCLPTMKVG